MAARRSLITLVCAIAAFSIGITREANGQGTSPASVSDAVLGTYAGQEPSFKDDEGELTGPCSYTFHFLANGRAFMDWSDHRTGKSGRTFGDYTIAAKGKEITVQAHFIPSMDSSAVEPPATDFFDTFSFVFSSRKVTARYMEAANAPTFLLSRVKPKPRG